MRILSLLKAEKKDLPASEPVSLLQTKQSGLSPQLLQLSLLFNQSRGKMKRKTPEKTVTV